MTRIYNWQGFEHIDAGFYGRESGSLAGQALLLNQVHGADCVFVNSASDVRGVDGDAMVTDQNDLILGIKTADCAPVLFAAKDESIIGAAHAGWRGALGGVLESVLGAMNLPADQVKVCVGPCISKRSYEVDEAFLKRFLDHDEAYEGCFHAGARDGHYMFDLEGFCALRLFQAGVKDVTLCGMDTYSNEDQFYSYRRATHAGAVENGRQIAAIVKRA